MRNRTLPFLVILVALSSCIFDGERIKGNGVLKTDNRSINNASKIQLMGGMDVYLEAGAPGVRVEGDENVLPYVETVNDNGWLKIRTKEHFNLHSENDIKVYVSTPDISSLKIMGSGNITGKDKLTSDNNIELEIAGSGNINLGVHAPSVVAEIKGSGNVHLAGETRDVDATIMGSGNFDSPDLKAENVKVKIRGSGDAIVFADVNLDASVAGSGNIKYRGNAALDKHISGSGSVVKLP